MINIFRNSSFFGASFILVIGILYPVLAIKHGINQSEFVGNVYQMPLHQVILKLTDPATLVSKIITVVLLITIGLLLVNINLKYLFISRFVLSYKTTQQLENQREQRLQ